MRSRPAVVLAGQIDLEWLRAFEDVLEVEVLLQELVTSPQVAPLAACRGAGPDLFYSDWGSHRPEQALTYGEECSVRSECLASGLELPKMAGVWGGTTGRIRLGMRRGVG